jgi:hypothetical protein
MILVLALGQELARFSKIQAYYVIATFNLEALVLLLSVSPRLLADARHNPRPQLGRQTDTHLLS